MLNGLLDLVAPSRCLACRARAPMPWCAECEQQATRAKASCSRCAGSHRNACPLHDAPFSSAVAAYAYTGVVARTIVAAKVGGATGAWAPLGQRLAAALPEDLAIDAVVPVPTEPRRRRARGVDHARILAQAVAHRCGVPLLPALSAARGSPDQGRSGDHQPRLPPGSFRARRALDGLRLLLVDDVLTTGATGRAAAGALVDAGAARVDVAVLARAGA